MANFIQPAYSVEQMLGMSTRPETKQERHLNVIRDYYDGYQGVILTERQMDYLQIDASDFPDSLVNVSALVVSKILDRLSLELNGDGILASNPGSEPLAQAATDWWVQGYLDSESAEIHRLALRDGAAAMFVEWQANGMPRYTAHPLWSARYPEGVRFWLNEQDPNVVDFAARVWPVDIISGDGSSVQERVTRLDLFVPDPSGSLVYRFVSSVGGSTASAYTLLTDEQVANELGTALALGNPQQLPIADIPIVRFENFPEVSEIVALLVLQRLLNKSLQDTDTSSDLSGSPMWTAESFPNSVDAQGNPVPIESQPNVMLEGTGIQRVESADLASMWQSSGEWIRQISMLKSFPPWLLLNEISGASQVSGTALKILERGLTSQIIRKQSHLNRAWAETFDITRQWFNAFNGGRALPDDMRLRFRWVDPQTVNVEDQRVQAEIDQLTGVSAATKWEHAYGYDRSKTQNEYLKLGIEQEQQLVAMPDSINPDGDMIRQENTEDVNV